MRAYQLRIPRQAGLFDLDSGRLGLMPAPRFQLERGTAIRNTVDGRRAFWYKY